LSEEARAKLQQNSRAQLKKQKKTSQKPLKVNKKIASGPAMITKAVGTGDLEIESSSVSTDSGSPVTDGNNGKRKHVTEWLHKLPDKSSDSWTLPTHSQTVSISDDLSELADQTRSFAESIEPAPSAIKQFEPIGTKPQNSMTSAWDFPPPERSLRTPSPVDPTMITPRPMTSHPPVSMAQASPMTAPGSLTMMQILQQDRRRQLEEYKARQQQEAMNDWPGFADPTPLQNSGVGIWNSPQYWNPSEAIASENNTWGSTASPSWTSWWGNQANNTATTANMSTPTSLQTDVEGRYDPFLSNVWSPTPLMTPQNGTSDSSRQDPAASLWNYGPAKPENAEEKA